MKNTTTENTIYYAAYGMNTDPMAMMFRTGQPRPVGVATLQDHQFRFAHHADVVPQSGSTTEVMLWELTPEQLASLDAREGYPTYYNRKIVTVTDDDGQTYRAWMYYMQPGNVASPPSGYYLDMLWRGYIYWQMNTNQITTALAGFKDVDSVAKHNVS